MAKDTIPVSKFKARCLAILRRVRETGRPVVVTRFGERVAEIVPPAPPAPGGEWLGSLARRLDVVGDIVSPLDEEWEALEK